MEEANWGKAMEEMKRIQKAKGRILTQGELPVVAWPLSFYYTARCSEKQGDRTQAISSYRTYLEYWSTADSNLKQLVDARQHLTRLLGQAGGTGRVAAP